MDEHLQGTKMISDDESRIRKLDERFDSVLFPNVNVKVANGALERSPIYLSVFLSFSLSVRSLLHSSVCLSAYLSFCLSVRLTFCLSFCLFDRLPLCSFYPFMFFFSIFSFTDRRSSTEKCLCHQWIAV